MSYPDYDRIRAELQALRVAEEFSLVWEGKRRRRPAPDGTEYRAWEGSDVPHNSFKGPLWNDYTDPDAGGSAIDLLIHRGLAVDHHEAAELLAARYGLWLVDASTYREASERARRFGRVDARTYISNCVAELPDDPTLERFKKALGLDVFTVCARMEGEDDPFASEVCLAWLPACPWLGAEVIHSGWKKSAVAEAWSWPSSARIFCLDLDTHDATGRLPTIRSVMEAASELGAAAVVLSSLSEDGQHSKAHIYLRSDAPAGSFQEYAQAHALLVAKLPEELRGHVDGACSRVNFIARLPGQAKHGKGVAAILVQAKGGEFCLADLFELQERSARWPGREVFHRLTFGDVLQLEDLDEDGEPIGEPRAIGWGIWPVARYEDEFREERGVVVRAELGKKAEYIRIRGGLLADTKAHNKAVQVLGDAGARFTVAGGRAVVNGLAGLRTSPQLPQAELQYRPGWIQGNYVQRRGLNRIGGEIFLCDGAAFQRRGHKKGTVESWKSEVGARVVGRAPRAAICASLAGALLRPLRQHSFVLHFCGESSSGKSITGLAAASVWGPGDQESFSGLWSTWRTTVNALENLCESANDACLVLDELKLFEGDSLQLGEAAHTLGAVEGKSRMFGDGRAQRLRRWHCVTVSNGENTISELIGHGLQGGHLVRVLDVPIVPSDIAPGEAEANALKFASGDHYGELGEAFVRRLESEDLEVLRANLADHLRNFQEHFSEVELSKESNRVLRELAIIRLAGFLAVEYGLLPWSVEDVNAAIVWVAEAVVGSRQEEGLASPEARALRLMINIIEGEERRAPRVRGDGLSTTPDRHVAIIDESVNGVEAWTTEEILRASGLCKDAGVNSVRTFLSWLEAQGLTERRRTPFAGRFRRWWVIDIGRAMQLGQPKQQTLREVSQDEIWEF